MTDEILMDLLCRDAEAGMCALMEAYMKLVCHVVRGRLDGLCPAEDMEECVSDVFCAFFRQRATIDLRRGSIKSYLCAMARNLAADVARARRREPETVDADAEALAGWLSDGLTPEEEVLERERREALSRAIGMLGDPDREIIVRKYYLDEPSRTIADRLGMSVSAVDTRAHRALEKLRRELEEN